MSCATSRRGRQPGRGGTAALEFGLIAPMFLVLVLSVTDLGRFYLTLHSLHTVLGDAARAAIVDPTLSGCSAPAARVAADAPFLAASQLSLCVAQSVASGITTITVNASYSFNFLLPSWQGASGTLTDSTTVSY